MNRLQRIVARLVGIATPTVTIYDIHGKLDVAETARHAIEEALKQSGLVASGADPFVKVARIDSSRLAADRPGIKPAADPQTEGWTWQLWRSCMNEYKLDGWTPCRFGNRQGLNDVGFVFGCVRGEFGIWYSPLPVCDFEEGTEMVDTIMPSLTFLPSGLGIGVFHDMPTAAQAAELAAPILSGMDPEGGPEGSDWFSRRGRLHETFRFHGIREDETRHAHNGPTGGHLDIWRKTQANVLEGKPEKLA